MTEIQLALLLIAIVIVITAVSRGLGASTPIAMVLGGLLLSFVPGVPKVELPPRPNGRLVVSRRVTSGPGWHRETLGDLPSGIFVVQLSQGERRISYRVAVMW